MDEKEQQEQSPEPCATNPAFSKVPVEVIVSVGKARPQVGELLNLSNNSVLALDQSVSDPVELYIGSRLIARGELQEMEGEDAGRLAVRLTEVANPDDSL